MAASKREIAEPASAPPAPVASPAPLARLTAGGTEGNERLTTLTGAVLLVGLAALGITIVRNRQLLNEHMFLGMLLIGPVVLKLGSTGYRFLRYYTRAPRYRRKGPPEAWLRLLAPLVVLSTVVVFASGVVLMLLGPSSRGEWLPVHKVSFFVWLAALGLHVLGHLADLQRVLAPRPDAQTISGLDEARAGRGGLAGSGLAGRDGRALALGGLLAAGVVLAIISIPQFAPWAHAHFPHH